MGMWWGVKVLWCGIAQNVEYSYEEVLFLPSSEIEVLGYLHLRFLEF